MLSTGPIESSFRVLVVDDEAPIRRLIAEGLTELGFRTTMAADGSEALALLRGVTFDAVVVDLQMAPVGGWEVIEYLRDSGLELPTLLLSAHIDVEGTVSALRAGVIDVLQKPVRLVELSSRLKDGIAAHQRRSDEGERAADSVSGVSSTRHSERRVRVAAQSALTGAASILGRSDSIQAIRVQVEKMRRFHDVPVLVIGDSGTGKSLVASRIHEASCPDGPYVVLGCGTLPPQIFDRELFGYDPGAFPDARLGRPGKFEQAEGGTVVLEGVEHLASEMQGKLFSVLEAGEVKRLNSDISRPLDCRLICTTSDAQLHNQPIRFRQDLYSRISGVTLQLQPLAARLVDLEDLATDALRRMSDRYPGLPTRLHDSALRVLSEYCWPGNVSELQAVIGQAAILSTGSVITGESIQATLGQRGYQPGALHGRSGGSGEPASSGGEPKRPLSIDLNAMQREVTTQAYRDNDRNLARTARALGLPRTTLRDRLRRYGEL